MEEIKKIVNSKKPEYVKNYNQQYYAKTRAAMLLKMSERTMCGCGCTVSLGRLNKHKKTPKHINKMKALEPVVDNDSDDESDEE